MKVIVKYKCDPFLVSKVFVNRLTLIIFWWELLIFCRAIYNINRKELNLFEFQKSTERNK